MKNGIIWRWIAELTHFSKKNKKTLIYRILKLGALKNMLGFLVEEQKNVVFCGAFEAFLYPYSLESQ